MKRNGHLILYTCPHHLQSKRKKITIAVVEDCIAIRCNDLLTLQSWGQRISVCLVSAFIQSYYYNLEVLWELLARSMIFIGNDVHFSTQHIIYFPFVVTSQGNNAFNIFENTKNLSNDETWHVEFFSELNYPFVLELAVVRYANNQSKKYMYRIQQQYLLNHFERYCLDLYIKKSEAIIESRDIDCTIDFPKETNHMLNAIMDDLFYDEDSDKFLVRCIEVAILESYLDESMHKNKSAARILQRGIRTAQDWVDVLDKTGPAAIKEATDDYAADDDDEEEADDNDLEEDDDEEEETKDFDGAEEEDNNKEDITSYNDNRLVSNRKSLSKKGGEEDGGGGDNSTSRENNEIGSDAQNHTKQRSSSSSSRGGKIHGSSRRGGKRRKASRLKSAAITAAAAATASDMSHHARAAAAAYALTHLRTSTGTILAGNSLRITNSGNSSAMAVRLKALAAHQKTLTTATTTSTTDSIDLSLQNSTETIFAADNTENTKKTELLPSLLLQQISESEEENDEDGDDTSVPALVDRMQQAAAVAAHANIRIPPGMSVPVEQQQLNIDLLLATQYLAQSKEQQQQCNEDSTIHNTQSVSDMRKDSCATTTTTATTISSSSLTLVAATTSEAAPDLDGLVHSNDKSEQSLQKNEISAPIATNTTIPITAKSTMKPHRPTVGQPNNYNKETAVAASSSKESSGGGARLRRAFMKPLVTQSMTAVVVEEGSNTDDIDIVVDKETVNNNTIHTLLEDNIYSSKCDHNEKDHSVESIIQRDTDDGNNNTSISAVAGEEEVVAKLTSVVEEEVVAVEEQPTASRNLYLTDTDHEASEQIRAKILKRFLPAKPVVDRIASNRAKIDDIVAINTQLVRNAHAEATLRINNPLHTYRMHTINIVTTSTDTTFLLVREALQVKANRRSEMSRGMIIEMLKNGCRFSPFLVQCSEQDFREISDAAVLRDIENHEIKSEEPFAMRGEALLYAYVIIRGHMEATIYEEEEDEEDEVEYNEVRDSKVNGLKNNKFAFDEEEEEGEEGNDENEGNEQHDVSQAVVDKVHVTSTISNSNTSEQMKKKEEKEKENYDDSLAGLDNNLNYAARDAEHDALLRASIERRMNYAAALAAAQASNNYSILGSKRRKAIIDRTANHSTTNTVTAAAATNTTVGNTSNSISNNKKDTTRIRTLCPGDFLGEFIIEEGRYRWDIDVNIVPTCSNISSSSDSSSGIIPTAKDSGGNIALSLCCIPVEVIDRCAGRRGSDVQDAVVLFWKHKLLWHEITRYNQELILSSVYRQATGRHDIQLDFLPMNVIDSARLRVYQPGAQIFTQGMPRHFLYIILRGCCEYTRVFPDSVVQDKIMPHQVPLHGSALLMCGDFSFMDGEDPMWLQRMNELDRQIAGSAEDSKRVQDYRKKKYCRFDFHKNSLIAASRVEIAVVPCCEIAKCMRLLYNLIKIATIKYPATFISNEDIVRRHYEHLKWQEDRKAVMRSVVHDAQARTLNEIWHQSPHNNVDDHWYHSHQPWSGLTGLAVLTEHIAAVDTSRDGNNNSDSDDDDDDSVEGGCTTSSSSRKTYSGGLGGGVRGKQSLSPWDNLDKAILAGSIKTGSIGSKTYNNSSRPSSALSLGRVSTAPATTPADTKTLRPQSAAAATAVSTNKNTVAVNSTTNYRRETSNSSRWKIKTTSNNSNNYSNSNTYKKSEKRLSGADAANLVAMAAVAAASSSAAALVPAEALAVPRRALLNNFILSINTASAAVAAAADTRYYQQHDINTTSDSTTMTTTTNDKKHKFTLNLGRRSGISRSTAKYRSQQYQQQQQLGGVGDTAIARTTTIVPSYFNLSDLESFVNDPTTSTDSTAANADSDRKVPKPPQRLPRSSIVIPRNFRKKNLLRQSQQEQVILDRNADDMSSDHDSMTAGDAAVDRNCSITENRNIANECSEYSTISYNKNVNNQNNSNSRSNSINSEVNNNSRNNSINSQAINSSRSNSINSQAINNSRNNSINSQANNNSRSNSINSQANNNSRSNSINNQANNNNYNNDIITKQPNSILRNSCKPASRPNTAPNYSNNSNNNSSSACQQPSAISKKKVVGFELQSNDEENRCEIHVTYEDNYDNIITAPFSNPKPKIKSPITKIRKNNPDYFVKLYKEKIQKDPKKLYL